MEQRCYVLSLSVQLQHGQGAACHAVNSKWIEKVEMVTAQQVMCLEKLKAHWNDKLSR